MTRTAGFCRPTPVLPYAPTSLVAFSSLITDITGASELRNWQSLLNILVGTIDILQKRWSRQLRYSRCTQHSENSCGCRPSRSPGTPIISTHPQMPSPSVRVGKSSNNIREALYLRTRDKGSRRRTKRSQRSGKSASYLLLFLCLPLCCWC